MPISQNSRANASRRWWPDVAQVKVEHAHAVRSAEREYACCAQLPAASLAEQPHHPLKHQFWPWR
jgi:hypothetical protein